MSRDMIKFSVRFRERRILPPGADALAPSSLPWSAYRCSGPATPTILDLGAAVISNLLSRRRLSGNDAPGEHSWSPWPIALSAVRAKAALT
jgi:hypothetical protein